MVHQNLGSAAALIALLLWTVPAPSAVPDTAGVVAELRRLEREFGGHLGFMAKDLRTGATISYNAGDRFPTASVIKLPVMAAYFGMVRRGKLDPGTIIEVTDDDKKPGSGFLQFLTHGATITLRDAVFLMIRLSDNSATNLVLDHMGPDHDSRMRAVNDVLTGMGLKDTRLLNRLYSWETKKQTGESIRYGIGVTTPSDMIFLLEQLHGGTLLDSASRAGMLEVLGDYSSGTLIPRFLPSETCRTLTVAHKSGGIQETKADVGLVRSDRADMAIAVFVDKHDDHRDAVDNRAVLLVAHAARAAWNFFTGDSGYATRRVVQGEVDWTSFPGGQWGIYRSPAAPFPHPDRAGGLTTRNGTVYPPFPHYRDSSIVVVVPDGFSETDQGANLIVHFHGHKNDNLGVLEQFGMPMGIIRAGTNALLVIPQGPYRARDSFGGRMEDAGGFGRMVEDVLRTMAKEGIVKTAMPGRIIVSAHSGGYRPAAFTLALGGLTDRITHVFLFDAFYGEQEMFREWLLGGRGTLLGAYTEHLAAEHRDFETRFGVSAGGRLSFVPATSDHNGVVEEFFGRWLAGLDDGWKIRQR